MLRGVGALLVIGGVGAWSMRIVSQVGAAARAGAPVSTAEALTAVAAAGVVACLAWLALAVVLQLLCLVPGAVGRVAVTVADAVTPRLVRRVAGAALGLGVAAGLAAGPVAARPHTLVAGAPLPDPGFAPPARPTPTPVGSVGTPGGPRATPGVSVDSPAVPDPGWVPTAPAVRAQPDVRVLSTAPPPPEPTTVEVVVRRGDSLWAIVARHLGPQAGDAEVAETWPAWFAANRDVIGDDPDLLLPGQVLRAPEAVGP